VAPKMLFSCSMQIRKGGPNESDTETSAHCPDVSSQRRGFRVQHQQRKLFVLQYWLHQQRRVLVATTSIGFSCTERLRNKLRMFIFNASDLPMASPMIRPAPRERHDLAIHGPDNEQSSTFR
jgi:hypothetical protein